MVKTFLLLFATIALVSAQTNTTTTVTPTPQNVTTDKPTPTSAKTPVPSTTTTTVTTQAPTTVSPVPTGPPAPAPALESWSGNVTIENKTCISAKFSVQIEVKYNNTNNTEWDSYFNIPVNASVDLQSSHCSNDTTPEVIVITFKHLENTSANLTLTFNQSDNKAFLQSVKISFNLTQELIPNFDKSKYGTLVMAENDNVDLFGVAAEHSYVCSAGQAVQLETKTNGIIGVQISFTDTQVEAYMKDERKGKFDSQIDCKSSEISDVVPIAVGAALAGLVVIVLIAYFVGRRRSRRLAYQSV